MIEILIIQFLLLIIIALFSFTIDILLNESKYLIILIVQVLIMLIFSLFYYVLFNITSNFWIWYGLFGLIYFTTGLIALKIKKDVMPMIISQFFIGIIFILSI